MSYRAENKETIITIPSINILTNTGDTTWLTLPYGVNFAVTGALIVTKSPFTVTSIGTAKISVGNHPGVSDANIVPSTALTGFTAANQTKILTLTNNYAPIIFSGNNQVVTNVVKGTLSATSFLIQLSLIGYYY